MGLDNEKLIQMYTTMIRIRRFEEQLNIQIAGGTISGFVHLYLGQEAVATGVCGCFSIRIIFRAPIAATVISLPRGARQT